jgi:hypothetical protein
MKGHTRRAEETSTQVRHTKRSRVNGHVFTIDMNLAFDLFLTAPSRLGALRPPSPSKNRACEFPRTRLKPFKGRLCRPGCWVVRVDVPHGCVLTGAPARVCVWRAFFCRWRK